MSYVPYKNTDEKWYWRGPEVAFRDFDNNGTKDETNAADGTFYSTPVLISAENPVLVRKVKKFSKYRSGSRYKTQINRDAYEDITLKFVGPVYHRNWLYYLTDACTTTDDTPEGYNTHVYVNTATHVNPPKTFELFHKLPNDKSGGGETVLELFTGCEVVSYVEKASEKSPVAIGEWTVKAANVITATALTTPGYPEYPDVNFANFADATLTWNKGGSAVNGHMKSYEFGFITNKNYVKEGGSYYPVNSKAPTEVEAYLRIEWLATETDSYDDSQDDPLTALNKDITLKSARNATNDYFQVAIVDGFQEMIGQPVWDEGNMIETHEFSMNPHEATPSSLTLTEVNDISDDEYET